MPLAVPIYPVIRSYHCVPVVKGLGEMIDEVRGRVGLADGGTLPLTPYYANSPPDPPSCKRFPQKMIRRLTFRPTACAWPASPGSAPDQWPARRSCPCQRSAAPWPQPLAVACQARPPPLDNSVAARSSVRMHLVARAARSQGGAAWWVISAPAVPDPASGPPDPSQVPHRLLTGQSRPERLSSTSKVSVNTSPRRTHRHPQRHPLPIPSRGNIRPHRLGAYPLRRWVRWAVARAPPPPAAPPGTPCLGRSSPRPPGQEVAL